MPSTPRANTQAGSALSRVPPPVRMVGIPIPNGRHVVSGNSQSVPDSVVSRFALTLPLTTVGARLCFGYVLELYRNPSCTSVSIIAGERHPALIGVERYPTISCPH